MVDTSTDITETYSFGKMSALNWNIISIVKTLEDVKAFAILNDVSQNRINNLKDSTKILIYDED